MSNYIRYNGQLYRAVDTEEPYDSGDPINHSAIKNSHVFYQTKQRWFHYLKERQYLEGLFRLARSSLSLEKIKQSFEYDLKNYAHLYNSRVVLEMKSAVTKLKNGEGLKQSMSNLIKTLELEITRLKKIEGELMDKLGVEKKAYTLKEVWNLTINQAPKIYKEYIESIKKQAPEMYKKYFKNRK